MTTAAGWRPDPATLRWAAGEVRAAGPTTPDTTPLYCAREYIARAAHRLTDHADTLDRQLQETAAMTTVAPAVTVEHQPPARRP